MNTYAALSAFLGSKSSRRVPKIRSTTVERWGDGTITVNYHQTPVVTAHPDGSFTLNNGGFQTSTTKSRINEFSPAHIYQKDFNWYLSGLGLGPDLAFENGVEVDSVGLIVAQKVA